MIPKTRRLGLATIPISASSTVEDADCVVGDVAGTDVGRDSRSVESTKIFAPDMPVATLSVTVCQAFTHLRRLQFLILHMQRP